MNEDSNEALIDAVDVLACARVDPLMIVAANNVCDH
jgi:hypothetical protein